ncbi:MAG TPA: hypothetical protein VFB14_20920 [Bryobacteraceae bacterium]|jgi:hypothetical protein|nr:hypothetical protein [Bryobacteraceae bacterium]
MLTASDGAATAKERPLVRKVFSFPAMLAVLLVALAMLTIRSRFDDPDLWWHLKTGEIIWNTHSIPRVDAFSFTAGGQPWVAQEWLSELAIYAMWKSGAYTGLMLGFSVLTTLLLILAYVLCSKYSANCKIGFGGALAFWLFSTIGLALRPHMIGYLLLVLELLILHLSRSRRQWLFALVPLFSLWVNCHASFFFGLIVLAIVLLCAFLPEIRWGLLVSTPWEPARRNTLAICAALSVAALFLNPIGPRLVTYPLDVFFRQPVNLAAVAEWRPPAPDDLRFWALLLVAGAVLLLPLLRFTALRMEEFLLVSIGFELAVSHQRMLFVFGLLAAPVLCRLAADLWGGYEPDRDRMWLNASLMAVAAIVVVFAFPNTRELKKLVRKSSPVQAVEFLKRSGIPGNLLNEYVYGGYLIWAAPERKVFIDGRADIYEKAGVLSEYEDWIRLRSDPKLFLAKYRIGVCLLSPSAPMTRVVSLLPGWKRVYSDNLAVLFVKSP